MHDLDALLELRSTPFGKHTKTITVLTFNARFAVMTQNTSECALAAVVRGAMLCAPARLPGMWAR